MLFYCSTLSAPRCNNVFGIQQREEWMNTFLAIPKSKTFPISTAHRVKFSSPSQPNARMKTPKFLQKQKSSITGSKKKKLFDSIFTLREGSGNYRKKWPQDVLHVFRNGWFMSQSPSQRSLQHCFCCNRSEYWWCQTLRPTLFANLRLPHLIYVMELLLSRFQAAKIISDRTDEFWLREFNKS